ncbi:hypothetical protein [Streptomyces sp. S1D4-20]|uniref:hypothetical protein n=1 Tax=Streptomyces sp. S1D4-20 TaxID=2594462 RepID=UPI0011635DBD|nr:hypothetical protein [Streptomyces sp. S1D4-20]QDN54280.1 hypothetical protein FNV67_01595 [Streptomyces sp. S1D4-20]
MPNTALARAVLEYMTREDPVEISAADSAVLEPDGTDPDTGCESDCQSTAKHVDDWVAHLSNYTLRPGGGAVRGAARFRTGDAARTELGISQFDAARLFGRDLLQEQVVAALDQLADGAPTVDWEVAHSAAYGLADGDFSAGAAWEARRVWGITHDLLVDGTRRSGARGISSPAMRFIVAGWDDAREPGEPRGFWRDDRGTWTTTAAAGHRYVPRLDEAAVVHPGSIRGRDDARRILGDLNYTPVAPFGDRRLEHLIVPAAKLRELLASPQVSTPNTPDPQTVYTYLGATWPPLTGDACQRCRSVGFLARATEWTGHPAFCTDCHETLRTWQAQVGHQCVDGCPQPVDHTGLCIG